MSDYFPSEVLSDIFQRLPIKSVGRCMCVCKAWKSIITTDSFITSYYLQTNHANNNSSLFFHLFNRERAMAGRRRSYSEGFPCFYSLYSQGDILLFWELSSARIIGTCNGVVCYSSCSNSVFIQYIICNPCIHKYVKLPKPSLPFQVREGLYNSNRVFCGFGYDSRHHDFKLLRCITPPYDFKLLRCITPPYEEARQATPQAEIYSHASRSWRFINVAVSPFRADYDIQHKFVNGVMHWMASRTINGMTYEFILTFDFAEEKFGELMLPESLKESIFNVYILPGGDYLAVIHRKYEDFCHEECCEIWVMEEYGVVDSWNQLFHFPTNENDENVVALRNSGEVVLESSNDEIIFRDPINGIEKKLEREDDIMFVDHYVESLFLTNEENA